MEKKNKFRLKFDSLESGRLRADFVDLNGDACSMQESSSVVPAECVWVGQNEGNHHMGECMARGLLSREMAREVGLWLLHFARTGRLTGQPDRGERPEDRLHKKLVKAKAAAEDVSLMIPDDAHSLTKCRFVGARRIECWACLAQDKLGTIYRQE
jgi:hypothetical protein